MDLLAAQVPDQYTVDTLTRMTLVVRSTVPPASLGRSLRAALHRVDPGVPFRAPLSMEQVIAETLIFERLESWLFAIFAALALTLSLIGIYGMVHLEVELRRRDIGVRMALGSSRMRVVGELLQRVGTLMLAGVSLGWLLTFALRRAFVSVIELRPAHDAALLAALTGTLAVAGLLAAVLPAHRAASIDPIQALRTE